MPGDTVAPFRAPLKSASGRARPLPSDTWYSRAGAGQAPS
jgi:hypothetical protein